MLALYVQQKVIEDQATGKMSFQLKLKKEKLTFV
jgi:hypothetical protein